MPRRPLPTLLSLLLLLTVGGAPAVAQNISSPYRFIEKTKEVSLFGSWYGGGEGRFGFGSGDGPMGGARFGFEISGAFGGDIVGWFAAPERAVIDPTAADGPAPIGTATLQLFGIEVRPRFSLTGRRTWNGLQPYLLSGIGFVADFSGLQRADLGIADENRFDFGTKFNVAGGAGIRFFPTDLLVGRIEFAGLFHQIDTPGGFSDPELELGPVAESEWVVSPTVNLSLGIRF